jgi:hypothetical protein
MPHWDWRAAVELCLDKRSIAGIGISNINIENSLSNGLSVIAKNEAEKMGVLSNAILKNVTIRINSNSLHQAKTTGLNVLNNP